MNRRASRHPLVSPALLLLAVAIASLFAAGPCSAEKNLTVKLPASGAYQVWLEAETASGPQAQAPAQVTGDRAALPLPAAPAGLKEWRVLALDEKSGYVAAQTLPAKNTPAEIQFAPADFNRIHHVRVQVTGAGGKPVASASVMLADAKGGSLSRVIDAGAAGVADFTDVPSGAGKLTVTPTGGKSTTKEVDINLPKGETTQQIAMPLPEVTAVVEAPATTAAGGPAGTTAPASPASGSGAPAGPGSTGSSTPPASAPPSGGGEAIGTLIGLIFVFALLYVLFLYARNQGWTVDKALARLGVQPVSAVPAGSAAGTPAPPPPPPPPVDPNICPFCGQRKDPVTGACACSLDAAPAGAAPLAGGAFSSGGSGPRLVAVSGAAMGQIFPISGEAVIGRDAGSAVALPMDSTVSRRHAVISPVDGGYVIRDQGSSNGTYVNGARVEEAPLRAGDEVSIGGTRFRFEA